MKMHVLVLTLVLTCFSVFCFVVTASKPSHPDLNLTTPEFIRKYGYPVEIHHVTTDDGYILELHRIPYGLKSPSSIGKPTVFLQHGTYSSSFYWVILGTENALAFVLADAGYDVWMGNSRGNTYSRHHVTFTPTTAAFWRFSWHERGVLDLPAMIDKALQVSQNPSLYYIGYSKGTTMFFVLASERPEFNAKIKLAICLATVTFKTHINYAMDRLGAYNARPIELLSTQAGIYEYSPSDALLLGLRLSQCDKVSSAPYLCEELFFRFGGYGIDRLNQTLMSVFISHVSPGLAQREIAHSRQLVANKRFCQYDFGAKVNVFKYGIGTPPDYKLANVVTKVALIAGDGDNMSSQEDVNLLRRFLSNVVEEYHVSVPTFNHVDFVFATDAKTLVYDHILRMMKTY